MTGERALPMLMVSSMVEGTKKWILYFNYIASNVQGKCKCMEPKPIQLQGS